MAITQCLLCDQTSKLQYHYFGPAPCRHTTHIRVRTVQGSLAEACELGVVEGVLRQGGKLVQQHVELVAQPSGRIRPELGLL